VERGERVRAFHRPDSPLTNLEGLDVEHVIGDITWPETVEAAMPGVEVVIHTASQLSLRKGIPYLYKATVEGAHNVMQAALKAGVNRLVHTSSSAAMGLPIEKNDHVPYLIDENHTWNYIPKYWPYGHAKYLAELEVQKAIAQGLEAVIVCPTVVIGAGDINLISGNLILHVAKHQVAVGVTGGLNAVHVDDVVRGHLAALECGRNGERYILGNQNLTHMELIKLIATVTDSPVPYIVLPGRIMRHLSRPVSIARRLFHLPIGGSTARRTGYLFYYSIEKARTELGLSGLLPLRQAVEEAYAWYMKQDLIKN
jgi:dihydroflavonol-4-reductase